MLYKWIELALILAVYFVTFWTHNKKRYVRYFIYIGALATIVLYAKNWKDADDAIDDEQTKFRTLKTQYDTLNNQYSLISDSLTLALQELRRESDQVDSLMKLSKSGLEQINKTISGKNDLSLLSARPELIIRPINQTDLKRDIGSKDSALNIIGANHYTFYYTFENIGGSSAIIDSTIYEWDWRHKYVLDHAPSVGIILAKGSAIVGHCNLIIDTTIKSVFGLHIFYRWAESAYSSIPYETFKCYEFEHSPGNFRINTVTPSYFRNIVNAIPDSLKFTPQQTFNSGAFIHWLISK